MDTTEEVTPVETPAEVASMAVSGGPVKPKDAMLGQEFGVPTTMPFTSFETFVNNELHAPNRALISVDRLIEMRQRDGQVRALLRLYQLPIMKALMGAEWIKPDEGGEEETKFANQMFTLPPANGGMSISQSKFMRHVLLSLIEGFSYFEEVRQIAETGPLKGKIVLRKIAHRASNTITFITDEKGGFDGARQSAVVKGTADRVRLPKEKSWYYAVNEEENAFYGVSFFEAAWHHWDIKRKLYYISHLGAQMAATMGRMGVIPKGASLADISAFQKMLADFAFNTSGTHPEGYEVKFANQNTNFDFIKLIDHQNAQMAKSVLAKFLEDEQRSVLIDNSGKDAEADFFVMALESVMGEIAEGLSHYLMPKYIDWNFNSGKYPTYRFGVVADTTRDIIKDLFSVVATAQDSQWTPEFIRELEKKLVDRLGLEVDYKDVDKREQAEADEEKRLQEEYFAQQAGGGEFGGAPGEPPAGPVPTAVAASMAEHSVNFSRVMDQVERLLLARRESDLDGGN